MKRNQLDVTVGQCSSPGRKTLNQDFHGAVIPDEPQRSTKGVALAIADGISSSDVSQIASETAVKSFLADYYSTSDAWSVKNAAGRVLAAANSWLHAQTRSGPHRHNREKGYVCTFSAVVFKSSTAHLFHSGDTRIYRVTDGDLEQLTTDHRGFAGENDSYLTRALGMHGALEIEYRTVPLAEGDCFILATDGVYAHVRDAALVEAAQRRDAGLNVIAEQLVHDAYAAGSEDNLTLQIVRINRLPDPQLEEFHQRANHLPFAPALAPRMHLDAYELLRELHCSSRSHVFLAVDTDSRQQVAIKVPSTGMQANHAYLEGFLMEDWIAQRIDNAHVLSAFPATGRRSCLYTVTEYVEGRTLTQWMADNPAPTLDAVRDIVAQIAKGLQAFHRLEMVHQDIRPDNVMIDHSGTVKIIDFGSTRVAGVSEFAANNHGFVGTVQYTAPECFLGRAASSRSDIFSLGVVTYQMLCGRLPYGPALARARSASAQRRLRYRPIRDEDGSLPGWVDYALARATHLDPRRRYAELSEFVHDLTQPNATYLRQERPPLAERNPVLFWQCVSAVLLGLLLYQAFAWGSA